MGVMALLMMTGVVFAQVTAISEIQTVADPETEDASPLVGQTVTIEAWVIFEPMSKGGSSFFVADDAGAWNGVNIYASGQDLHFGFGWKLSITGEVGEYQGLTQVMPASEDDIVVLEDDVDWGNLPAACTYTVVPVADLGTAATAEQWESTLIQINDVTCTNDDAGYGEWEAGDGTDAIKIDNPQDDDYGYAHKWVLNQPYDYIRGVFNSHYGYKILPEISYDLNVAVDEAAGWYDQVSYFQQVRPMDMTVRFDDDDNDYMWDYSYATYMRIDPDSLAGDTVTVHGIVTMPTGLSFAGDGIKFIFSDYSVGDVSEPWSAVLSYHPDSSAYPNLLEGDEIEISGFIGEYSTGGSNMTELWITSPVDVLSIDNATPTPDTVTVPELRNTMTAERWGNVMVTTLNNVVTNNNLQYELFAIDNDITDEIPAVPVDDDSDAMDDYVIPPLGANVESITGWLYHHYGDNADTDGTNWAYKIEPLYPDWIVLGEAPPNILTVSRDLGTPGADQAVVVTANIADNSAVTSASIMYKLDGEDTFTEVAMENTEGIEWEGTIPGQADGSMVWYYVSATDDNSTTTTSPSNLDENLYGYWAVSELGIYEVQYTPFAGGTSPYDGYEVTITGVVTMGGDNAGGYADDTYGPAYFMQVGDSAPYSGIVVHIPTDAGVFMVGDDLTVTGTVEETGDSWEFKWGNNTRLINVTAVTNNGAGTSVTYDVDAATVNANLEAYESVQVQFTDITISTVNQYDWTFSDGDETFLLDDDVSASEDLDTWFDGLAEGTEIDFLRGVITYSFGSWKLEVRDMNDIGESSVGGTEMVPLTFNLEPVYPNPFNPSVSVRVKLGSNAAVTMKVFDLLGRQVAELNKGTLEAGTHTMNWNAENLASGVYFLNIKAGSETAIRKVVLMR
jgi:hypothetical protein